MCEWNFPLCRRWYLVKYVHLKYVESTQSHFLYFSLALEATHNYIIQSFSTQFLAHRGSRNGSAVWSYSPQLLDGLPSIWRCYSCSLQGDIMYNLSIAHETESRLSQLCNALKHTLLNWIFNMTLELVLVFCRLLTPHVISVTAFVQEDGGVW